MGGMTNMFSGSASGAASSAGSTMASSAGSTASSSSGFWGGLFSSFSKDPSKWVGGAMALSGGLSGALSGNSGSKGEAEIIRANADLVEKSAEVSEYNARLKRAAADREAGQIRKESKRYLGAIRAGIGKSGVTSEGTPVMVMAESAMNAELDALNVAFRGAQEARAYLTEAEQRRSKADIMRREADLVREAGKKESASNLLTSAAQIGMMFI